MTIYEVIKEVEYSPDMGFHNEKYVNLTIREIGSSDTFNIKMIKDKYDNDEIVKGIIKNEVKSKEINIIKTYDINLTKGMEKI